MITKSSLLMLERDNTDIFHTLKNWRFK